MIIANNIAELRKIHNYTQFELAQKLNYSDKSVSKWERGESVPDIVVLKEIADLFGVSLDYMVQLEHKAKSEPKQSIKQKLKNHGYITGISIILVWLLATIAFVIADIIVSDTTRFHWLSFLYAVPVSMIVWLIMNSIWFNRRRNFLIISLLMWSVLVAVFISVIPFANIWKIFSLGIFGQIIILLWSRLRTKKQ